MIEIIPAIDIMSGQCVRLTKGDFTRKRVYNEEPLQVALRYEEAGFRRLHVVDLDGARAGSPQNLDVLHHIARNTALEIDFGGGVQSDQAIRDVFRAGARWITAGSIAVKNRHKVLEWVANYGAQRIILGADVRQEQIAISGWQESTALHWRDFLSDYAHAGITRLICTDVLRDGNFAGPALDLYGEILSNFPQFQLIASGGVRSVEDIHALQQTGVQGVIIGKAFYEDRIQFKELESFLC